MGHGSAMRFPTARIVPYIHVGSLPAVICIRTRSPDSIEILLVLVGGTEQRVRSDPDRFPILGNDHHDPHSEYDRGTRFLLHNPSRLADPRPASYHDSIHQLDLVGEIQDLGEGISVELCWR